MKTPLFLSLVVVCSLLLTCQSPVGSITRSPQSTPGTVRISFQTAARTLVANWATTITSYSVTLTNGTYGTLGPQTASFGGSTTFSNVTAGTWDVAVTALNGATIVGGGTLPGQLLTNGTGPTWTVPISGTQTGTGSFSFAFSFPLSTSIDSVTWEIPNPPSGYASLATPQAVTLTAGNGTIAQTIKSGAYRLVLRFYRLGVSAGVYSEAVNVWDNVTSASWLDPTTGNLLPGRTFLTTDFNSTDDSLSGLSVSAGTLAPAFSSGTLAYTVTAASLSMTPTKSIDGQLIQYSTDGGSTWLPLPSGTASPSLPAGTTYKVKVTAPDQTATRIYTLTVNPGSPNKDITSFGLAVPSFDASWGVITGTNIAVEVPAGTSVTNLVASFVTTGASVAVAATPQTSGVTNNNFSSSVNYTVTAADSSTKTYTVTVSVAPAFKLVGTEYNGTIWTSLDSGVTWTSNASAPTTTWGQSAGSANGTILYASAGAYATPSYIYKSTDSGTTWTALPAAGNVAFNGMASSDTGSVIGSVVYDGTSTFYYSTDTGTTWNTTSMPDVWWGGLQCSSDGKKWLAYNGGASTTSVSIFTGTFDGVSTWNWTRTSEGWMGEGGTTETGAAASPFYTNGWSLSKDGTKIFLTFNNNHTYLSTDFGLTWPVIPHPGTTVTGSTMSGNGLVLVIIADGLLYTSTNSGTTWNPASIPGLVGTAKTPSISNDGSRMSFIGTDGAVYFSLNSGATFSRCSAAGISGHTLNSIVIQNQ